MSSLSPEQRKIAQDILKRSASGTFVAPKKADPKLPLYQKDPALYISEKLGVNLTPDQRRICDAVVNHPRVLVKASHSVGKCLHEDQVVPLANGALRPARELVGTSFTLMTLQENILVPAEATAAWNSFEDTTYTIRTAGSKMIRRNGDHPLWSIKKEDISEQRGRFRKVRELHIGDYLAAIQEFPVFGQNSLSDSAAKAQVAITKHISYRKDLELLNEKSLSTFLKHYLKEYFKLYVTHRKITSGYDIQFKLCLTSDQMETADLLMNLFLRFGIHLFKESYGNKNVLRMTIRERGSLYNLFKKIGYRAGEKHSRRIHDEIAKITLDKDKIFKWEKISSIERDEKRSRTVAICVPGHQTFVTQFYEHNSYIAAALALWHYDVFNPGIVLTTAPKVDQVKRIIWGSIRTLARGKPEFRFSPSAPLMMDGPTHYAQGLTGRDSNSFQGVHHEHLFIIFDEAVGIRKAFWEAARGMATGPQNKILAICNPTDISSAAYEADKEIGQWHTISISSLNHPNVLASLNDEPEPYPGAASLTNVLDEIDLHCIKIREDEVDFNLNDFEFPLLSGNWYHPDALFESRLMGKWPTSAVNTIWGEALIGMVESGLDLEKNILTWKESDEIEIGVDVGWGSLGDSTCIHARRGPISIWHESHKGFHTDQTAGRIKQLCNELGEKHGQDPRKIKVKIDSDGLGIGVVDQKGDYKFIGIHASSKANDPERYPNRRSELWFTTRDRAKEGRLDIGSFLQAEDLLNLEAQLTAPIWAPDAHGRMAVEKKPETKKRLKRSPDDADAFNLAYASEFEYGPPIILTKLANRGKLENPKFVLDQNKQIKDPDEYAKALWSAQRGGQRIKI